MALHRGPSRDERQSLPPLRTLLTVSTLQEEYHLLSIVITVALTNAIWGNCLADRNSQFSIAEPVGAAERRCHIPFPGIDRVATLDLDARHQPRHACRNDSRGIPIIPCAGDLSFPRSN